MDLGRSADPRGRHGVRRRHLLKGRAMLRFLTCLGLGSLAACSLALSWDANGLPCGDGSTCNAGYTCLADKCVADGTVKTGETCTADQQCGSSAACLQFVCKQKCTAYFEAASPCSAGQYCKPFTRSGTVTGGCVASECAADTDCRSACVTLGVATGACITGCQVTFSGSTYNDNCFGTGQTQYCEPVGTGSSQKTACFDIDANTAGAKGATCSPFDAPCKRGLACINAVCVTYCDTSVASPSQCNASAGELCCKQTGANGTYGYCAKGC